MVNWILTLGIAITLTLAVLLLSRLYLGRRAERSPARRGLFVFSDGVATRSIDPIQVYLALEGHKEFRLDVHPKRAAEGDTEAMELEARAVREAFGVAEYTQPGKPGLTVAECHRLLRSWAFYVESQKKSINPSSTVAPSMESTSESSSAPTTPDSSPSGSVDCVPA